MYFPRQKKTRPWLNPTGNFTNSLNLFNHLRTRRRRRRPPRAAPLPRNNAPRRVSLIFSAALGPRFAFSLSSSRRPSFRVLGAPTALAMLLKKLPPATRRARRLRAPLPAGRGKYLSRAFLARPVAILPISPSTLMKPPLTGGTGGGKYGFRHDVVGITASLNLSFLGGMSISIDTRSLNRQNSYRRRVTLRLCRRLACCRRRRWSVVGCRPPCL